MIRLLRSHSLVRIAPALKLSLLLFALAASPAFAAPTLRATLTAALHVDRDLSGGVTCGDLLRYSLAIEPTSEFGTDLQNVVFDIVPGPHLFFDPDTVFAENSDQRVRITADPESLHVEFGRVCNSSGCPGPFPTMTFDGLILLVNTGTAISLQGSVSGTNFATTQTDGTPGGGIDPTVTPYPACPPAFSILATKSWSLIADRDRDGRPDPGDGIRYSVRVQNGSGFPVRGVRFDTVLDADAPLVAGTVTASRGAIVLGNGLSDSSVRVSIGDLAGGANSTITFDARLRIPFPDARSEIACQGTVSSEANDFAPTPTDDPTTATPADPTRTSVDFDPDLALTKSDSGALARPDRPIAYALTVTNLSSRATASNVVLSETVPAGTAFDPSASSPGWNCLGPNCTFLLGSVAPRGTLARVFAVRPAESLPAGTLEIANTARTSDDGANGPEPDLANNVASDTTPIDRGAFRVDLSLAKDDGGASVRPGAVVVYRLTAGNRGALGASGVVLAESVPRLATFEANASTPGWSCRDGSGEGTACSLALGTLEGGSFRNVLFAVRAAAALPAGAIELRNTAKITDDGANGPDSDLTNNEAVDTTPFEGAAPSLRLAKTLDPASDRRPGGLLVWVLRAENQGNQAATGVVLREEVPSEARFEPASSSPLWSCQPGPAGPARCSLRLDTLAAGARHEARFALRLARPWPAGVEGLPNCATLEAAKLPAVEACADAPIDASPDLALDKSDGDATARPAGVVVYTLRFENRGTQGARGVLLHETVPLRSTFVPIGSSAGWTCTPNPSAGSRCTLSIGDMAVGASREATFAVRVDAAIPAGIGRLINTALVEDDGTSGPEPDLENNLSEDATPLEGPPPAQVTLRTTKRDRLSVDRGSLGLADAGDTITYTVVLENPSTVPQTPAMDLVFTSGIDPHTELLVGRATTTRGTIVRGNAAGDSTVEVRIPRLGAGESATLTFEVRVATLPTNASEIACQGTALLANGPTRRTDDPDTAEPDDPTRTPVARGPRPQPVDIPTLGPAGFTTCALAFAALAWARLRDRRRLERRALLSQIHRIGGGAA